MPVRRALVATISALACATAGGCGPKPIEQPKPKDGTAGTPKPGEKPSPSDIVKNKKPG